MPFSKFLGNDLAKSCLQQMLGYQNTANTLLFHGPEGVGKSLFALELAVALMGPSHKSRISTHNHPDLHILRGDGKSGLHAVESIRSLIEEVLTPPFEASCKVFIIHDAHHMLPVSANALLKTLEEPHLDAYIILLTDQPEILLPTLLSRCRKIPFFPIPQDLIETHLITLGKSQDEAERIVLLSDGSLSRALMFASESHQRKAALVEELFSCRLPSDYSAFIKIAAELEKECGEDVETEGESKWRQMDAIFEEILFKYSKMHRTASQKSPPLERIFERIERCRLAVRRHIKLRVVLEEFFSA